MKPQRTGSGKIPYEGPADAALRALRGHLELVEIEAALGVYLKSREHIAGWQPPPREWIELIKGLVEQQDWECAILVMQHYEREVEAPSSRVRLKLAQLLIQHQERPARALKVLGQIPAGSLSEPLESLRREIAKQAQQMLDDGVLELGDEV